MRVYLTMPRVATPLRGLKVNGTYTSWLFSGDYSLKLWSTIPITE